MNKRIFNYILIGIILYLGIVLVVWAPWKPKPKSILAQAVNDLSVVSPVFSNNGQEIFYYDQDAPNLYKINLQNNVRTQLSETIGITPSKINWSPNRTQAIVEVLNEGDTALWYYDLATQKSTRLDNTIVNMASENMLNPIWTADSKKIIYFNVKDEKTVLNISSPDGTNVQSAGTVPDDIYSILSFKPNDNLLYYGSYSNESNLYQIIKYDLKSQTPEILLDNIGIVLPIDETRIMVDDSKNSLIFDLTSRSRWNLPIRVKHQKFNLSPDKKKLVASIIDQSSEKFYLINLVTRKIIKILDPGLTNTSYYDLNLDSNGNIIFTSNNKLYKIGNTK